MGLLDIPWLTDALKKRALRYLLQRYMGHFLAEKLSLEQLSIDLYDGTGCIKELALDVDGLNEELVFLPFQFTEGCEIKEISCSVPWSSLTTESCSLEIHGARFHLNFCSSKPTDEDHLYESSYLSKSMMSSSMQMAEEIACADKSSTDSQFEGLEMMAQLIDSVLRRVKVVATDTTIVMRSATAPAADGRESSRRSGGQASSVEFKIKYLRCEEDMLDPTLARDMRCNTPGNIDKLLTLEGVEVGINGRSVSRIGGKHLIKIRANQEKSDLQIFLGSPLLAILNSSELKSFFDVFSSPDDDVDAAHAFGSASAKYASKPMTEEHFFHLETILQQDAQAIKQQGHLHHHQQHASQHSQQQGLPLHQPHNLADSSLSPQRWGESGFPGKQFHPLSQSLIADDDPDADERQGRRSRTQSSGTESSGNQFSCFIKIPGVYLCLFQRSDQEELPAPMIPLAQVDFQKINRYLDDIVKERNHVRVIAFPIHLDINKSSSINVIVGDAMVLEQSSSSKVPLFWSESDDKMITSPKYRCEIRSSCSPAIIVEGHETTCITCDPTILERLHEYTTDSRASTSAPVASTNSTRSSMLDVELRSHLLKVNLLFPVPDLRDLQDLDPQEQKASSLRADAVMFVLEEVVLSTNLRRTHVSCDDVKAMLTENEKEAVVFMEAKRNPVDPIELVITHGPESVCVSEEHDIDSYLGGEIGDSVYYSNLNEQEKMTAFRSKRKLIHGASESDYESIVCPSDRKNTQAFLSQARACTGTQIEVHIPSGEVAIDQRQLNLVYNRFANDLVMWVPRGRPPAASEVPTASVNVYKPCVSAMIASTESVDSDSSFHSTEDAPLSVQMKNEYVILVNIDELTVRALSRDSSSSDQAIKGQRVLLGIVIGMQDEKKSLVFLNGDKASFHQGREVVVQSNMFSDTECTVDLTFEIHRMAKDFKKLTVAIGIEDAALMRTDVEVFKSFWDFINVTDEAILGYTPSVVTTELHVSLLKGIVCLDSHPDSRPALLAFDHMYLTSMVVEKNRDTLLRVILEEGSVYFSKTMRQPQHRCLRDYVCILESGLTDLSVVIKDEGRLELKVSNNVINLRVCSDSLSALCQLIMQLASPAGVAHSTSSQESLDVPDLHATAAAASPSSESVKGLEDREEDLLRDAIDECASDERDNVSIKSCENCDAAIRQQIDESGFWILGDDDVGTGITASIDPVIRKLTSDPINIKENHFTSTRSRPLPEILKETTQRFLLEQLTIICNFYGGRDFSDEVSGSSSDLLKEGAGREASEKEQEDVLFAKTGSSKKQAESAKGLRVTFKDDAECEPQVNLWESLNLVSGLESRSDGKGGSGCLDGGSRAHALGPGGKASGKSRAMEGGKGRVNDV